MIGLRQNVIIQIEYLSIYPSNSSELVKRHNRNPEKLAVEIYNRCITKSIK